MDVGKDTFADLLSDIIYITTIENICNIPWVSIDIRLNIFTLYLNLLRCRDCMGICMSKQEYAWIKIQSLLK